MRAFFHALELRQAWFLLCALAAVPVFLWARRAPGRLRFSSLAILPARGASWRIRTRLVPPALLALSVAALSVALAGPRIGNRRSRIEREGIAIMMVIDLSGSMRALDLSTQDKERTRLDAAIDVFDDFVRGKGGLRGRPDDAIGVVTFAGFADTRCPLTLDHDNLLTVAHSLEIVNDREEDGTAIGDGLGLAIERLRESKARSRVAILLTDGVNNAGELTPAAAAELAKTVGVKVYTIGAGKNGLAPVRVQDMFGRSVMQQMPVEIDEAMLRDLADKTGGAYFRATDADSLKQVYARIDKLERTELTGERYRDYREYYGVALGAGLLFATLALLGQATIYRRLP